MCHPRREMAQLPQEPQIEKEYLISANGKVKATCKQRTKTDLEQLQFTLTSYQAIFFNISVKERISVTFREAKAAGQ